MKRFSLLLVCLLAVLNSGCGKGKETPANPSQPAAETATAPAPQSQPAQQPPPQATAEAASNPSTPPPAQGGSEQLVGMVHGFMTQQLRIFVQQKGRLPQNFTEFTSARMDSVPRPPEGFHWAIDEKTIEVKLVR
jgi:hypothetical protein